MRWCTDGVSQSCESWWECCKAGGDTQSGHFRCRAHERTVVEPELFLGVKNMNNEIPRSVGSAESVCIQGSLAKKSSQFCWVFFSRLVKHAMIQLLQLNTCLALALHCLLLFVCFYLLLEVFPQVAIRYFTCTSLGQTIEIEWSKFGYLAVTTVIQLLNKQTFCVPIMTGTFRLCDYFAPVHLTVQPWKPIQLNVGCWSKYHVFALAGKWPRCMTDD